MDLSRLAAEILLSLYAVVPGADIMPPQILAIEAPDLQTRVCGRPCAVKAWYSPDGIIYIDNRLDPENDQRARSIIVHELVHHVQKSTLGGNADGCPEWLRREHEAYAVQAQWLQTNGVMGRDLVIAARYLRCDPGS